MIYIKVEQDMSLAITVNGAIYQGDNLAESLTYLVPHEINEKDAKDITAYLCYLRADGTSDIVRLNRQGQMYKDNYYQFSTPVTCTMTKYAGQVSSWLVFFRDGGEGKNEIMHTGECVLRIQESKCDELIREDCVLTAIYQMQKQIEQYIHAESEDNGGQQGENENGGGDGM